MKKEKYIEELKFCLKLWKENNGCAFGGKTNCEECAVPYILLKFISGELLHGDIKRLSLNDWENKLKELEKNE